MFAMVDSSSADLLTKWQAATVRKNIDELDAKTWPHQMADETSIRLNSSPGLFYANYANKKLDFKPVVKDEAVHDKVRFWAQMEEFQNIDLFHTATFVITKQD